MNLNQSKPSSQSKSILPWIHLDWKFDLDQSVTGFIGLKTWFRIVSDSFGLGQIDFLPFFIKMSYKTSLGLVRNDSHWLGYRYRNKSELFWLARNIWTYVKHFFENFIKPAKETGRPTFTIFTKVRLNLGELEFFVVKILDFRIKLEF